MTISRLQRTLFMLLLVAGIAACGSSSNNPVTPPASPPPTPAVSVSGNIYDGPVSGGSLYVFAAADVNAAIDAANAAADRAASLAAAGPIATLTRDEADGAAFALDISGDLAGEALFFVFDSNDAVDEEFGDEPFNLEAVAIAGDPGSQLLVNITSHTTLASIQVRKLLDPDGNGSVIDAASIQAARDTATANAIAAFGTSSLGEALFTGGEDPHSTTDLDVLAAASSELGLSVRMAAALAGLLLDEAVYLFAADVADGEFDGDAPPDFGLETEEIVNLLLAAEGLALGGADLSDIESVSCTSAANSLRRACEFEALDEFFVAAAICAHSESEADAESCLDDSAIERDDLLDECGAITDARLELCVATDDAAHNPSFGADFAADFVDPLQIGVAEAANPWFPMVQGNEWVYEGTFDEDGELVTEVITITVTNKIKLIDGIRCLVVRDVVEIDGELIEDTDDWFAQDRAGNIWYCGEEVKDYETFDGDVPALPELVAIDGSFKAGRDGDEAGIQLPIVPEVGDIYRQEVSFTNAEDVIEILAVDASESVPGASCAGDCLVTRDFSPLEPDAEENKYYAPGIGKILEVDLQTGNRVELISFTSQP
ncbi:MAG: hypothetical protein OEO82_00720 [Gammaproteobacteria bacterium]|nr:hypothetical protein [Gammaproteobacteria bacterium]